ncbi:MAG: hypothetical protein LC742_03950 [Acidobacteria bacterium]|nr:hypothetical protein [Acidobacteriota bacterium]
MMGMLFICVMAMFEMTFRQRRSDTTLLQKWIGNGAFHADFLRIYNRGRKLSTNCDEYPQLPLPEAETDTWIRDAETFLSTQTPEPLNELYVAMFHEDPGLTKPVGHWGETPQAKLRYKIDCHKHQLNKIMSSLAMMRVSGVANQFGPNGLPSRDRLTQSN